MDLQDQAEAQLARREAVCGRVTNRESYLKAIVARLEREQSRLPGATTQSAQAAMSERNEREREPLPEPATDAQKMDAGAWFATMRQALGRPKQGAS